MLETRVLDKGRWRGVDQFLEFAVQVDAADAYLLSQVFDVEVGIGQVLADALRDTVEQFLVRRSERFHVRVEVQSGTTFTQSLFLLQFFAEHFDEFLAVARLRRTVFADGACLQFQLLLFGRFGAVDQLQLLLGEVGMTHWQRDAEGDTRLVTLGGEATVVQLRQVVGQVEAQRLAALAAEALKDILRVRRLEARTAVEDVDADGVLRLVSIDLDEHLTRLFDVLEGVGQEVEDDLVQLLRVAVEFDLVLVIGHEQAEVDLAAQRIVAEELHDVVQETAQRHLLDVQSHLAVVDLTDIHLLRDEHQDAQRVAVHHLIDRLRGVVVVALHQSAQGGDDQRERGLDLVTHLREHA